MDIVWKSLTYIFKDDTWVEKVFKGRIIAIIPILNILLFGYMEDVINSIYRDKNNVKLPEFNILDQFIRGLKLFVIFTVYTFVIFMLFIIILAIVSEILNLNDDIVGFLFIVFSIIFMLLIQVIIPHYIYNNNIFSLFDFITLYRILERTWFSILIFDIVYIIISFIVYTIAGMMLGSCILGLVGIWLIGALSYYYCVAFGYFSGNIYLQGIGESTSRRTTIITSKTETSKPVDRKVEGPGITNTTPDSSKKVLKDKK